MVDANISDLFFNSDLKDAEARDGDGYDHDLISDKATEFLGHLEALGVDIPTNDELVEDFFNRL